MALHNETMLRERTIPTTKHRPKNILGQMKRRLLSGGCKLQVAGCRLQVQVAGCRLQVAGAGCRLQVAGAGCRLQVAGCDYIFFSNRRCMIFIWYVST